MIFENLIIMPQVYKHLRYQPLLWSPNLCFYPSYTSSYCLSERWTSCPEHILSVKCLDSDYNPEILKDKGIPDHLTGSWEIWVRKQQLDLDMEQQTGSKLGKEYSKAVYCHPACLTYMQSTRNAGLDETQAGIKISGENINNLRYADNTTLMVESKEELKSLLMKVKESEKLGLKLNIQKTKIMASGPITSWK